MASERPNQRFLGEEWRLALALVTISAFGWWVAVPYAIHVAGRAGEGDGSHVGIALMIGLLGGLVGVGFFLAGLLFASRPRRIALVGLVEVAVGAVGLVAATS
ncbi:MAG: hypothetical protein R3C15_23305 [Thermoleophilia bacterium]